MLVVLCFVFAVLSAQARPVSASCNQIPGTANFFRGARGSLDRPFAGPGDFVMIQLSSACDAESPGFGNDAIVSVAFHPAGVTRRLVVIAPSCAALASERERCGGAAVECIERDASSLIVEDSLRLRFRFPDTDALSDAAGDDRTLAGSASIAVSNAGMPLPCDLGATPCKDQSNVVACVDTLFTIDGTCGTTADAVFSHFTALPPPNDYQALCTDPIPPCTGQAGEFRFTIDAAGNILIPMDWRGILVGQSVPVARLLRTTFAVDAFPDRAGPIRLPGNAFLHSYSLNGGLLPPIFEPQTDAKAQDELVLFGSADAPATVLQILRRSPAGKECSGGERDAEPCVTDDECDGGSCGRAHCVGGESSGAACQSGDDCGGAECGRALFDFATRAAVRSGAVIVSRFGPGVCQDSGRPCLGDAACAGSRCVAYRVAAKDPVALDGLVESPDVFVSVVPEAVDGIDRNGDGDVTDDALLLADRKSGRAEPIGEGNTAGRAATRLHQPPFSYPAVVADGDIVAFLEAEPLQGNRDANADGDRFDTILRVYRRSDSAIAELTEGHVIAVDAAPRVNGGSLAINNGLVFFRQRESASAPRRITRASIASDGSPANADALRPSLSKDGRHVAFESSATNLAGGRPVPDEATTYVHDRRTGLTTRVVLPRGIAAEDEGIRSPSISGDGRYVTAAVKGVNGHRQVIAHDRDADRNGIFDESDGVSAAIISYYTDLVLGRRPVDDGDSFFPAITPNARFVVFPTLADYLDRFVVAFNGALIRVDRDPLGTQSFDYSIDVEDARRVVSFGGVRGAEPEQRSAAHYPFQAAAISHDGRFVAFASYDRNLPFRDLNDYCLNLGGGGVTCADIILRDTLEETVTLESISSEGEQGNNQSLTPAISADGSIIAFESAATNFVSSDTNSAYDVFVRDRSSRTTTRVSVSSSGEQGNAASFGQTLSISDDGRFVAFGSRASNLVAGDTNDVCTTVDQQRENCGDIFVHDRLTGFTERVSMAAGGTQGDGRSGYPSLSANGDTVAFESRTTSLAADSGGCGARACTSILVAAPDPARGGDLNGDGDLDDTLLSVFDTSAPGMGAKIIGAAADVVAAGSSVAFLVPEEASGRDLNDDGDSDDMVAHLYRDGEAINLRRSALQLALSEQVLALRVDESAEGSTDLNDDGDVADSAILVYELASARWINLAQAATAVAVSRDEVVFSTPEAAQQADLNGDADRDDHVLQAYSVASNRLTSTHRAIDDLVLGDTLVAFRVPESAQAEQDLNGDGDSLDSVLHILNLRDREIINTEQAAIPCRFSACDARFPYRVFPASVKFLTFEEQQQEDLNDDGDRADLVLQTFNVAAQVARRTGSMRQSRTRRAAQGVRAGVLTTIGAVSAGICTDSGRACAGPSDCGTGGRCFVPPGGCIEKLSQSCDTSLGDGGCTSGAFCVPTIVPGKGACHVRRSACAGDSDCVAPARCQDAGQSFQRLVAPMGGTTAGQEVFVTACDEDIDRCTGALAVAAAGDGDADGIADPFDNCARRANSDQRDANANGVGDVCELVQVEASPTPSPLSPTQTAAVPIPSPTSAAAPPIDDGCSSVPRDSSTLPTGGICLWGGALLLWHRRACHRRRLLGSDGRDTNRRSRGIRVACRQARQGMARFHRLRARRAALMALSLLVAGQGGIGRARASDCFGDCNESGLVDVLDLLTPACPSGDTDADGIVSLKERILGIHQALQGCAPSLQERRAALETVLPSLLRLPMLELVLSAVIGGAGNSATCDSGGRYLSQCEHSDDERIRVSLLSEGCNGKAIEGFHRIDGEAVLLADGLCPRFVVAGTLALDLSLQVSSTDHEGAAELTTSIDAISKIESFFFDRPPCRVRGGIGTFNGSIAHAGAGSWRSELSAHDLRIAFVLTQFQFDPVCDPGTIRATVDGRFEVDDGNDGGVVVLHARRLEIVRNRLADTVALDGEIVSDALAGAVRLRTLEPLLVPLGEALPVSGVIEAHSASETQTLRFAGP